MNKILFSIIIPLRTIGEGVIKETLPAIASQSYKHFEVIILPDAESDQDHKLTRTYDWLRIIPTPAKKMPGDKRDIGAQDSYGDILAFLDDDALPVKDWLENAYTIFDEQTDVVALGGPGLLPPTSSFMEEAIDAVLTSFFTNGALAYRFKRMAPRYVDDFPSMNLMMRKDVFIRLGGFDNRHWPGEDSKLINKLLHREYKQVLYDPGVAVYHHRRSDIRGHLKQHKSYGYQRGLFVAEGDENSQHITYMLPSLFTIYFFLYISGLPFFIPSNNGELFRFIAATPLFLYLVVMIAAATEAFIKTKKILIIPSVLILVPLTHLSYGTFFLYGYGKAKIKNFLNGF
ncbi:glycosyltransferase [soil metagenome]